MRDILVVEDGVNERSRLVKLFGDAGFSVDSAESVEKAESLLKVSQFRLVVLDISLGDRSGSHLFEQIRHLPEPPYVVVLTGNPSIYLKQRFLQEGAVAHIVKATPEAENQALLEKVCSLLGTEQPQKVLGLPLVDFLRLCVSADIKELFLDAEGKIPRCSSCGSDSYFIAFDQQNLLPPKVEGTVRCSSCGKEMNLEVG